MPPRETGIRLHGVATGGALVGDMMRVLQERYEELLGRRLLHQWTKSVPTIAGRL